MKSAGLLIGSTLAAWAVAGLAALQWGGHQAFVHSLVAVGLCLVPTMLTLVWTLRSFQATPEHQLLAVLGGTAVRLVFVIGVGMALYHLAPGFQEKAFWYWVIGFYLLTLAVEVGLLAQNAPTETAAGTAVKPAAPGTPAVEGAADEAKNRSTEWV